MQENKFQDLTPGTHTDKQQDKNRTKDQENNLQCHADTHQSFDKNSTTTTDKQPHTYQNLDQSTKKDINPPNLGNEGQGNRSTSSNPSHSTDSHHQDRGHTKTESSKTTGSSPNTSGSSTSNDKRYATNSNNQKNTK